MDFSQKKKTRMDKQSIPCKEIGAWIMWNKVNPFKLLVYFNMENINEYFKDIGFEIIFRNVFYDKMIKQLMLLMVYYIFHKSCVNFFFIFYISVGLKLF